MRPDRRSAPHSFIRINHKIKVAQVRCIDSKGEMVGVLQTRDALQLAHDCGLDLVEVSPNADPPVCRVMDFGKYRYEESMKKKEARKNQQNKSLKEIKYHANVGEHDYQTKLGRVHEFLEKGHKVKLSLMFRGRENAHRELGFDVIKRVITDSEEVSTVEMAPRLMGRSIIAMLASRITKS